MNNPLPPSDNPISASTEDRLGRAAVAHDFAKQVRGLDASKGLVVAVMGPWGYGKTSFVYLMREQFTDNPSLVVIDFNPWMFSGAQQLTEIFFKEIAAELRVKNESRFNAIANGLDDYGDVLGTVASVFAPFGAAAIGGGRLVAKAAAKISSLRRGGTRQLHEKVADALAALDQPVVVVIDDIDRLSTEEIRDIFKLVRLTGSFPNLIYVLAFDRERVERALDEANVPGRAYLEKIVQLSFDLPAIQRDVLQSQVIAELDRILGDLPDERFDPTRWPDVFAEVVEPLFTNLRDVTRFALSARPTLATLGQEIDFVDLVAIEAIRVFRPEVFGQLPAIATELTSVRGSSYGSRDTSREKAAINRLVTAAGDDADVVRSLISRVFPAARQYIENYSYGYESSNGWRASHRVAHIDWLSLYLSRVAPSQLQGFRLAEVLLGAFAEPDRLSAGFDAIPPNQLEDVLDALLGFADRFPASATVPVSVVLENLIPAIPERPRRGMFDFNRPEVLVARVVLQLLLKLEPESERETAVLEILPQIETLSSRYEFIRMVGHIAGSGHKLISESLAERLEAEFEREITRGTRTNSAREWDAARVYYFAAERTGAPSLTELDDPDLIRSLLRSAKSARTSQSIDSRSLRAQDVLWWDGLLTITGSEGVISAAADALRAVDGTTPLVALVDRYLSGWRPKDWEIQA